MFKTISTNKNRNRRKSRKDKNYWLVKKYRI